MALIVGVDAGGTKTIGVVADETGHILKTARAGGANLHVHGELAVEKVLHERTLAEAGLLEPLRRLARTA